MLAPIQIPRSLHPRVSILICSKGGSRHLAACLRSIALHAPQDIAFETIVVVNGASELGFPTTGVQVVGTSVNLGLPGAANLGHAHASGEYILLLHDDTEVEPLWMDALVQAADEHPRAGAVGSLILNMDRSLQFAALIQWANGNCTAPWLYAPPAVSTFGRRRVVDACNSSSLLVRAASWDRFGGLDEQLYPALCVDLDLSMGVWSLGEYVLFEPASQVRHHLSGSQSRLFHDFLRQRNHRLFIAKWSRALATRQPFEPRTQENIRRALAAAELAGVERALAPEKSTETFRGETEETRNERYLRKERELAGEYTRYLENRLGRIERHWLWRSGKKCARIVERLQDLAKAWLGPTRHRER